MTAHELFTLLFAPSGQNAGAGLPIFLIQIGALIAIFYFMLIRPQRRQQEKHRQLLASLQRGDRIVTSGGIIGEVVLDRSARQHREHPQSLGGGRQTAVTIRQLHLLGSPILRQRATPVATVDDAVRRLVDDLFETMQAAKGVGLAANQVGVARRVAVVDVGEDAPPPLVLINPRIVQASDVMEAAEEGCLSIPDIYGEVERHLGVTLEALDRDGRLYKVELSGFKARAAQHEIDHLDGVLFLDHLSAVKRGLLLAKWKKARKGQSGYLKDVTPEPAGEL